MSEKANNKRMRPNTSIPRRRSEWAGHDHDGDQEPAGQQPSRRPVDLLAALLEVATGDEDAGPRPRPPPQPGRIPGQANATGIIMVDRLIRLAAIILLRDPRGDTHHMGRTAQDEKLLPVPGNVRRLMMTGNQKQAQPSGATISRPRPSAARIGTTITNPDERSGNHERQTAPTTSASAPTETRKPTPATTGWV